MCLAICDGDCGSLPADSDMHNNTDIHHDSKECLISKYNNVDEQQQRRWQNEPHLSEQARAIAQRNFTQVTIPANERRSSCHGGPHLTHRGSNTQREQGDLVRSPSRHVQHQQPFQYNDVQMHSYERIPPINAINKTQCSAAMLLSAYTYPSGACQHRPSWAAYQAENQTHSVDCGRAFFSPIDLFSPYVGLGIPPTPADTIGWEEIPRNNSVTSDASPPSYYPECEGVKSRPDDPAPACGIKALLQTAEAVSEQQETETLPTPPPEQVPEPQEYVVRPSNIHPLETQESMEAKPDGEEHMPKKIARSNAGSPATSAAGEDADLNFLSYDWDTDNLDYLGDPNGFAPVFMSSQGTSWDTRQKLYRSAYPTVPIESDISTEMEAGPVEYQASSAAPSEASFAFQFNQHGGCHSAQSSSAGPDTFQSTFQAFQVHNFLAQPASTGLSNDRTSHRSTSKDQMLIDLKQRGYSYKDIKLVGQFEEAESTLRGRYRTLTKPKEARVRKPEWGDQEIGLLLQAVAAHTNVSHDNQSWTNRSASNMSRRASKIPWKQVAEYMALRGAYKYGNATVKKKWTEVMAAGSA